MSRGGGVGDVKTRWAGCPIDPIGSLSSSARIKLELLSEFIRAISPDHIANSIPWNTVLEQSPLGAIAEFRSKGLLIEADIVQKIDAFYSVSDLRALLKARELKASGRKQDSWQQRLADSGPESLSAIMQGLGRVKMLTCSEPGRGLALAYIDFKGRERKAAEEASLTALRASDFERAVAAVDEYQFRQVFPSGLGVAWGSQHHRSGMVAETKEIFATVHGAPKILSGVDSDKLRQLQFAAAWMNLWGLRDAHPLLPTDFECSQKFDASVRRSNVAILCPQKAEPLVNIANSGCATSRPCVPTTRAKHARNSQRSKYPLSSAPELPHVQCTHSLGCRCVYTHDSNDLLQGIERG